MNDNQRDNTEYQTPAEKRAETLEAREQARAVVRFRPLDYDRREQFKADTMRVLYVVFQGPFCLGQILAFPAGNYGFCIDPDLERQLKDREFSRTPWNRYKELFLTKLEGTPDNLPLSIKIFDYEDQLREALWAWRDVLFSWTLDVVIATEATDAVPNPD